MELIESDTFTNASKKHQGCAIHRRDGAILYNNDTMGHFPFSNSGIDKSYEDEAYGSEEEHQKAGTTNEKAHQKGGTMAFEDRQILNTFVRDERLKSGDIWKGCNIFINGKWRVIFTSDDEGFKALLELKQYASDYIKMTKRETLLLSPVFGNNIYDCRFEGVVNCLSKMKDQNLTFDTPLGGHLYYRNRFYAYPSDGNLVEAGNDIPYYLNIHTKSKDSLSVCTCGRDNCDGRVNNGDMAFIEGSDFHLLYDYMMIGFVYKLEDEAQKEKQPKPVQTCQIGYVTVPFTQAYQIANLSGIITEANNGVARLVIPNAYGGDQVKRSNRLFSIQSGSHEGGEASKYLS